MFKMRPRNTHVKVPHSSTSIRSGYLKDDWSRRTRLTATEIWGFKGQSSSLCCFFPHLSHINAINVSLAARIKLFAKFNSNESVCVLTAGRNHLNIDLIMQWVIPKLHVTQPSLTYTHFSNKQNWLWTFEYICSCEVLCDSVVVPQIIWLYIFFLHYISKRSWFIDQDFTNKGTD